MKSFLAELRRRHVFRVAAWYAVVAWLVIQVATNTFPHLLLPDWSVRLVIVLCLIGFPVALALAWALEVTPEGLKVATPKSAESPAPAAPHWHGASLWLGLAGGVLLGVGALQSWRAMAPEQANKEIAPVTEKVPARVLAVLPFENLGGDDTNAAFTAGIHDSLITRIAKIGGMTVISRTSVMAYEGARPNLKDVAKALGVTHVVEGSVQRAGDRVQIQTQLIDAATDAHLWAESYDRTLAEGFATQNEIATAIAQELSVRLSDREREALATVPTQNARAFEQYVLGHAEIVRGDVPKAIGHLQKAIELDPSFALAFTELSIAHSQRAADRAMFRSEYEQEIAAARQFYGQALALQPEMPEAILARGVYSYIAVQDYVAAEPDLTLAVSLQPNNYMALTHLGGLRQRQDRYQEAADLLERAAIIEPSDVDSIWRIRRTFRALRHREPIERAAQRLRVAVPDSPWPAWVQAETQIKFDGRFADGVAALERLYDQYPDPNFGIAPDLWYVYLVQGRYAESTRMLESFTGDTGGGPGHREKLIGLTYWLAGDQRTANRWLEQALSQMDSAELPTRRIDLSFHYEKRAATLTGLGRKEEALENIQKALAIVPRSMSAVDWASNAYEMSVMMLHLGDTQNGLRLIEKILDPPTQIMPYDFWFHFLAGPLRTNPEFRELMTRHGVDVTRDPIAEYAAQQAAAYKPK